MLIPSAVLVSAFPSLIKSIQPFSITLGSGDDTATASISSVDTTKTVLFLNGYDTEQSMVSAEELLASITLTDDTTVTAIRSSTSTDANVILGVAVEFISAFADVQYGSITISATDTSNTGTISTIDVDRSVVIYLGHTVNAAASSLGTSFPGLVITDPTTITATRAGTLNDTTISFCVLQLSSSVVNSVQQVQAQTTLGNTVGTAAIVSVDMANSLILFGGINANTANINNFFHSVQLTDPTTIAITRAGAVSVTSTVFLTVLELIPGYITSIQRPTTTVGSGSHTGTSALAAIGTQKAVYNGIWWRTGSSEPDNGFINSAITSSILTTSTRIGNTGTVVTTPEIVEFV